MSASYIHRNSGQYKILSPFTDCDQLETTVSDCGLSSSGGGLAAVLRHLVADLHDEGDVHAVLLLGILDPVRRHQLHPAHRVQVLDDLVVVRQILEKVIGFHLQLVSPFRRRRRIFLFRFAFGRRAAAALLLAFPWSHRRKIEVGLLGNLALKSWIGESLGEAAVSSRPIYTT